MKPAPLAAVALSLAAAFALGRWTAPAPARASSTRYQFHAPGIVFDPRTGQAWAQGQLITWPGAESARDAFGGVLVPAK